MWGAFVALLAIVGFIALMGSEEGCGCLVLLLLIAGALCLFGLL